MSYNVEKKGDKVYIHTDKGMCVARFCKVSSEIFIYQESDQGTVSLNNTVMQKEATFWEFQDMVQDHLHIPVPSCLEPEWSQKLRPGIHMSDLQIIEGIIQRLAGEINTPLETKIVDDYLYVGEDYRIIRKAGNISGCLQSFLECREEPPDRALVYYVNDDGSQGKEVSGYTGWAQFTRWEGLADTAIYTMILAGVTPRLRTIVEEDYHRIASDPKAPLGVQNVPSGEQTV